jgi:hypothetical protein
MPQHPDLPHSWVSEQLSPTGITFKCCPHLLLLLQELMRFC